MGDLNILQRIEGASQGRYAPQSIAVISGNGTGSPVATVPTGTALNPLGVKSGPLDVVIFKGGYGDEYAIRAEQIFAEAHRGMTIKHPGIQRLGEQLQPRFVAGTPPDVIDNFGAGNLDASALVAEGPLADLGDLLDAPAFDTPGETLSRSPWHGRGESCIRPIWAITRIAPPASRHLHGETV